MTPSIIIPIRSPEQGKTRLGTALGPVERAALVEGMFRHVLTVATTAVPPADCIVVTRSVVMSEIAAAAGAQVVAEEGDELNAAIGQAAELVAPSMPLLVLLADLPFLILDDIMAMMSALACAGVVAASDRAGLGTNALLLRTPGHVHYRFGPDSLHLHRIEAARCGLAFEVIQRFGLSFDVDLPEDLTVLGDTIGNITS